MRIGIRSAISALVLTSIVVSAVGVHLCGGAPPTRSARRLPIPSTTRSSRRSATNCSRSRPKPAPRRPRCARCSPKRCSISATPEAAIRVPGAVAVAADHFLGRVRLARRLVLCRAQARRQRRRDARDRPDRKLRIEQYEYDSDDIKLRDSRVEDTKYLVTEQEWFREASADDSLVDADGPSDRRTAGCGIRAAHRHRWRSRRRARHHHRVHAGVEFPVAAHGRQIGRRLHPRPRRRVPLRRPMPMPTSSRR